MNHPAHVDAHAWDRVCELFDELVELPAAQREQRLAALAREAPAVARQVGAMLRADDCDSGVLEASLDDIAPELSVAAPAWETAAGSPFGPYRLLEPIGEGGMGEVWRAERADGAYQQQVALKLLKRGMDTQAILRRFMQERAILARLEHPGIVRVLDGGMSPDGRPWYAMTCVDGLPLADYAAHARLDARARIDLMATVADAVAYAHARLVVHRDLKPGNILVDAAGQPHLLDFGIAKLLEDTDKGIATGTGVRVLSPAYAAPEQILGQPVGTATDVYALGLVTYQLLTGRLPHHRHSRDPAVLAASVTQESGGERASHAITRGDEAALSETWGRVVERRRLARQVAGDLDLILATALRVEPERRYASADAFAADLRAWLEARPIAARADSAGYRLRRFAQRHSLGVAAAVLVALSLLGGLWAALWQAGIAREQAAHAEQQARLAQEQAQRAEATKNFVVSAFSGLNPTQAREGTRLSLHDFLAGTLDRLGTALADAPEARSEMRIALATALQELGDLEAARDAFGQAEGELLALPAPSPVALGILLHQMAMNRQRAGDLDAADGYLVRAIEVLERDRPNTVRERIAARTSLAALANDRGRYHDTLRQHLAIHDDRIVLNGIEDARMAVDWMNRCVARWWLADYAQAERDCRHAQALLDTDPQSPRARYAWTGNALALVLVAQGRWDEAERIYLEAEAIVAETLGPEHPMRFTLVGNRASMRLERNDADAALALTGGLLEHPAMVANASRRRAIQSVHAAALVQLRRLDEAERHFDELARTVPAAPTINALRIQRRHAELHFRQNRLDEATVMLENALAGYRAIDMQHHDDHARALLLHAELLDARGDTAAAQARREKAHAILRNVLRPAHPLQREEK